MPYVMRRYKRRTSRTYAPRRYANSYAPKSRRLGVPRLSSRTRREVTLSRYNLDKKVLVFADSDTSFPMAGTAQAVVYKIQPLYDFVNSTFYTTYVGPMYNQYRLKRVEYTITPAWLPRPVSAVGATDTALNDNPIQFVSAWDRSDVYGNTSTLTFSNIANYPDRKHGAIDGIKQFMHRQTITAQAYGQEAEWLSTDSLPAVAPNTMGFFNPSLYMAAADLGACDLTVCRFAIYMKYIVEVRGTRVM